MCLCDMLCLLENGHEGARRSGVTEAGGAIGAPVRSGQRPMSHVAQAVRASPTASRRMNPLIAALALAGAILPSEIQISIAGAKFTPGRMGAALLIVPAFVMLIRKGRRFLICDFL